MDTPLSPDEPVGYLKANEIGPALKALKAADFSSLDPSLRTCVAELTGWLDKCERSKTDLVCFYG